MRLDIVFAVVSAILLSGCIQSAEKEFWGRLEALCGNAYDGQLVSNDPQDAEFVGADLWMHVSECESDRILVDFMNGEDAVGHWVITQAGEGLELRHIHEGDPLTGYGGFSTENSSGSRMNFPADEATKALFDREEIPVSKQNIWAVEVRPTVFRYEMARPNRFFQVEFNTTEPISPPIAE